MKVLLTTVNSKYIHQNLAIRILYELNKDNKNLFVREFCFKDNFNEIIQFCSSFQLVAFSCYIWNIEKILELSKEIKKVNAGCKILLGGPEVSYEWNEIIEHPEIDYLILDEGEIPFSLFLKLYPTVEEVSGLVWKRNGEVVKNPDAPTLSMDQLKSLNPYASIPDEELRHKISYIEASRGCPSCCEFCLAGLQNKIRYLPAETIETNLLYVMERAKTIKFLDRTFNTNPAFAISIFRFILNHHKPGNVFQFEIKADIIQKELVAFIREHVPKGIFRFEIGIQTLNARSNLEVKRKQNFENIKKFVIEVKDNVEIHLDLIVGLPHDYFENIKFSFEEVFKLFAPELQLGFLKFLKGTPIRENYKEHGYKFDQNPPYQIIESNYLSKSEVEEISLAELALDIYWNKKRAIHTLRYVAVKYSIFDFLNGLGRRWNEKVKPPFGLSDMYTLLYAYASEHFPDDRLLVDLIALDYYLNHKVKPQTRFLPELEKNRRLEIMNSRNLNPHKFRYVMHAIHFSVETLIKQDIIEPSNDILVVQYTGINYPEVVYAVD